MLSSSGSKVLENLAIAGAKGDVPAGSEAVAVYANTPEFEEAEKWQTRHVLRRVTGMRKQGVGFYTWQHPTFRFSAARAFHQSFRPLVHEKFVYITITDCLSGYTCACFSTANPCTTD